MGDPLVIACIALGLSVVASAVRMVDWFLHADPRVAADVTRWGARGVAAASIPLLLVLLFKEQWTAATALAAAMVLVPAVLGRRLWRWVGVPSAAGYGVPAGASSADARGHSFVDEAELVRYSAAVLEAYLRRTAQAAVGRDLPAIADQTGESGSANREAAANRNGNAGSNSKASGSDKSGNGHAESSGLGTMSEDEACAVLGVDCAASEAEIRAAHHRISAVVDPAHGGSPYLAIKVDQAKEVLVRSAGARSANKAPKGPRKRSMRRPSA